MVVNLIPFFVLLLLLVFLLVLLLVLLFVLLLLFLLITLAFWGVETTPQLTNSYQGSRTRCAV